MSNANSTAFQYQKVTPAFLKRMCHHSDYTMFILKEGREVLGFCGVNFKDPIIAEIGPICVKTERRTHGLGRLLVGRIFEFLEPLDTTKVIVKVKLSNKAGLEFFTALGFNKVAEVSCGGSPAVVMDYDI